MSSTDIYADMVNAQLNDDLRSDLAATWYERSMFLGELRKRAKIRDWVGTPEVTDTLFYGVPGSVQPVVTGDEVFTPTLSQITKKIKVAPAYLTGYIALPKRLVMENKNSKGQLVNLATRYPTQMMDAMFRTMNYWLLTATIPSQGSVVAAASQLARIGTLNGAWASGTETGVTNGFLDFAAPSSQTDTVMNLAKSNSYGHVNQYQGITAWSTDGESKIRQLYRKCRAADPGDRAPDMCLMDFNTYDNLAKSRVDKILFRSMNDNIGQAYQEFTIEGMRVCYDLAMDRTASIFSGTNQANGFGYMLNFEYWTLFESEAMNVAKFESVPLKEFLAARVAWSGQLFCNRLNTQGTFDGGAI